MPRERLRRLNEGGGGALHEADQALPRGASESGSRNPAPANPGPGHGGARADPQGGHATRPPS
eukprot:6316805-Alexandrium_andersonii.AAC.1